MVEFSACKGLAINKKRFTEYARQSKTGRKTTTMQTIEINQLSETPVVVESPAESQIILPINDRGMVHVTASSLRNHFRSLHPNAKSNEIRDLVTAKLAEFRPVIDAIQQKAVADGYTVEHRETKTGRKIFTYVPPKVDKAAKAADQIRDLKAALALAEAQNAANKTLADALEKANAKLAKRSGK